MLAACEEFPLPEQRCHNHSSCSQAAAQVSPAQVSVAGSLHTDLLGQPQSMPITQKPVIYGITAIFSLSRFTCLVHFAIVLATTVVVRESS
jgi:hypothetical protein